MSIDKNSTTEKFLMKHSVAEKIRDKIEEKNLSVMGLEKKAGLKLHAVQNILSGQTKKPNINTLVAVANALGCSLSDLVDVPESVDDVKESKHIMFTNLDLLKETNAYLIDAFLRRGKNVSSQTLIEAIQEVYIYGEKNKGGNFDKDFADWMLDRLGR
jgi:transcriptional regulator with XRE-family HTH domain